MATLMLLCALAVPGSGAYTPPIPVAAQAAAATTLALRPYYVPTGLVETMNTHGYAFHYHPYPDPYGRSMRQVAAVRDMKLDWRVDGYASTPRCSRIGWYVRAIVNGVKVWLQQIDCSNPVHVLLQRARGLVLETDWWLANQQGWATYGGGGRGRTTATLLYYVKGLKQCVTSC